MKTKYKFSFLFIVILILKSATFLNIAQNDKSIIETRDKLMHSTVKEDVLQIKFDLERRLFYNYKNYVVHYYIAVADQVLANLETGSDRKKAEQYVDDAIENCNKSIELNEQFDEAYIFLSTLYGYKMNFDQSNTIELAIKSSNLLDKAKKMNPNNPRLYLYTGINNYYTPPAYGGGYELAEKNFKKVIELFPGYKLPDPTYPNGGYADAYGWLGQIAESNSNLKLAETYYKKGLEIDPNLPYIKYYLYPNLLKNKQRPPIVTPGGGQFIGNETIEVKIKAKYGGDIYYTLDGEEPTTGSSKYDNKPILINKSCTLKSKIFYDNGNSDIAVSVYKYGNPMPPLKNLKNLKDGLQCSYFEGDWNNMPDFKILKPLKSFVIKSIGINSPDKNTFFGYQISGYMEISESNLYTFYLKSDDGGRLYMENNLIIDNDGLHGPIERSCQIHLEQGIYPVTVLYFQREGGMSLSVEYESKNLSKQSLPSKVLFH